TTDGFHIWSEVFDRHLEDIFEVQDEIALKIAAKLKENFILNERSPQQLSQGTDNVEAYNLYLKAQYFWYKWSPEYALKAIEYYNRALDVAPNYAKAYSGLASCYSYLAATGHLSPSDAYTKAEQAARKAIDLDNHMVESHVALGLVRLFYKWNFKGALKSFKKALKLNPESAKANHALSFYAKVVGDFPAALHLLQQALKVDPLSAVYKSDLARAYLGLGNVEKALNEFNEILQFDPEFRTAAEGRGWCYVMLEDYENARREFKKYRKMIGKEYQGITQLGYVEAKMGNTDKVGEYLALLEHRQRQHPDQPLSMDFALIFLGLSKPDRVFHYLEQALEERLGSVLFIDTSSLWDEIKGDKRYRKFIKRIGLEQAPNLAGLGSAINPTA
ncbi:MAG: tetratricopeptide repeat protein, partial [Balneolaceae bacterium]